MITESRSWDLESSTLAELREIVTQSAGMPDDAVVRVRTRFGGNANGPTVKRIHIAPPVTTDLPNTADPSRR